MNIMTKKSEQGGIIIAIVIGGGLLLVLIGIILVLKLSKSQKDVTINSTSVIAEPQTSAKLWNLDTSQEGQFSFDASTETKAQITRTLLNAEPVLSTSQ